MLSGTGVIFFVGVKMAKVVPRNTLRMGLPSKGRMAEDTIQLLKVLLGIQAFALRHPHFRCKLSAIYNSQDCALDVYKPNPRQYIAAIPQVLSNFPHTWKVSLLHVMHSSH